MKNRKLKQAVKRAPSIEWMDCPSISMGYDNSGWLFATIQETDDERYMASTSIHPQNIGLQGDREMFFKDMDEASDWCESVYKRYIATLLNI